MSNVLKHSTRKRILYGYSFALSSPNSHSFRFNYFVIFIVLQKLREKAANRNEDEFYFKMVRTKTVDGVHRPE